MSYHNDSATTRHGTGSEFDNGLISIHIDVQSNEASPIFCSPDKPQQPHRKISLQCPLCDQSFTSKNGLLEHGRKSHLRLLTVVSSTQVTINDGLLVKCSECDFVVKRKGRLTRHLREEHGIHEEIKCESCGKEFKSHRSLQHHFSQFHTYNNIPCEKCGFLCKNRSAFQRHMLMHVRSFTCEQCGKTFNDRRCYTQHLKIHEMRPSVKCDHCDKVFANKFNMLCHVRIQHLKKGKLQCDLCQFSTFYKEVFTLHVNRVHKKTSCGKYSCSYCPKKFNRHAVFEEHVDRHEGRFRHSCHFCGKRYRNKARCKYHRTICPFTCQDTVDTSHDVNPEPNEVTYLNKEIFVIREGGGGSILSGDSDMT